MKIWIVKHWTGLVRDIFLWNVPDGENSKVACVWGGFSWFPFNWACRYLIGKDLKFVHGYHDQGILPTRGNLRSRNNMALIKGYDNHYFAWIKPYCSSFVVSGAGNGFCFLWRTGRFFCTFLLVQNNSAFGVWAFVLISHGKMVDLAVSINENRAGELDMLVFCINQSIPCNNSTRINMADIFDCFLTLQCWKHLWDWKRLNCQQGPKPCCQMTGENSSHGGPIPLIY